MGLLLLSYVLLEDVRHRFHTTPKEKKKTFKNEFPYSKLISRDIKRVVSFPTNEVNTNDLKEEFINKTKFLFSY